MPSAISALGRAALLCDPLLLEVGLASLDPVAALKRQICDLGVGDETAALRAAKLLVEEGGGCLDHVEELCCIMGRLQGGVPILGTDLLARRLARAVDPDALFPFFPGLELPEEEPFDWNAVPLTDFGRIAGLLDQGSTETHIHLGGALPPVFYWIPLMAGEVPFDRISALPAQDRGHAPKGHWMSRLACASWLRLVLASMLARYCRRKRLPPPFPWLPPGWELEPGEAPPPSLMGIRGRSLRLTRHLRWHRSLCDGRDWPFVDPFRKPNHASPGFGRREHYAAGERRLLYRVGRLLRLEPFQIPQALKAEHDALPGKVLEYLRIRNAFHRLLIHDRGSEGLLRFVETFRRRGFLNGQRRKRTGPRQRRNKRIALKLERSRMTAALDSQLVTPFARLPILAPTGSHSGAQDVPQRRIEMRVSVPRLRELRRTADAWMCGILEHLDPFDGALGSQVALVFHFLKKGSGDGQRLESLRAAERISWLLRSDPSIRPFVVGIDAAGMERRSNPRAFAPAFLHVRRQVQRHRVGPAEPPMRLGSTFHVGEDVEDLLTGLRHLDEVVSLLLPEDAGGRLGHALALGDEPERFYSSRGGATEPALGTHLLDLVWAWGRLTDLDGGEGGKWLEHRIQHISGAKLDAIGECYRSMSLDLGPSGHGGPSLLSEEELLSILGPRSWDRRGLPLTVSADRPWLRVLGKLQDLLIRRVARRRIAVEANPTSNLIIGRFTSYRELPYRRLIDAGIPVSLNTDDPGLFMTTLPGEFSAMYEALEEDLPHRQRLAWLADRRFDAEQSTFLGRHVPAGGAAAEWIKRRRGRQGPFP
ncbi:MAG: hypothetical protein KDD47_21070 [Acidobacteria bacterium]|nr:hypothetical protein [Acidobacteriota bacterium]